MAPMARIFGILRFYQPVLRFRQVFVLLHFCSIFNALFKVEKRNLARSFGLGYLLKQLP